MRATQIVKLSVALVYVTATAALAQQPPLPSNHPEVKRPAERAKAARLTEQFAGSATAAGPAAPVVRRNLIDEHIFGKMQRDGIPHAPLASDEEFYRRIHLDLTGRIGTDEGLRQFVASADAAKRDKLIDALIGSQPYRAKWAYWFGDLSMAAANRVGNEGKNLYYRYLYDNIQLNRPYNLMVTDMLTTNAVSNWYVGPASYLARWVVIGLTCEDTVHEDTSDELAIHTAKHFLGINLSCVSCHDGRNHCGANEHHQHAAPGAAGLFRLVALLVLLPAATRTQVVPSRFCHLVPPRSDSTPLKRH